MTNHDVHLEGIRHVETELQRRGAGEVTRHGTRKIVLRATDATRSRTVAGG